ncbi:hypothetical protein ARMGADRAFT_158599 [Armillaria gallica]|uniref:Uncharacterized protein n=1 Tax=Armillaria gallica TaxID=47427 RepID=A0A2H3CD11_ARMGA|nr:hypothetical protein ARMGADRAFT_176120 [Armillaria gallica]PBK79296.1 hypothetical protein ARMGADRAFT_158599 [Armillaria gallica]
MCHLEDSSELQGQVREHYYQLQLKVGLEVTLRHSHQCQPCSKIWENVVAVKNKKAPSAYWCCLIEHHTVKALYARVHGAVPKNHRSS